MERPALPNNEGGREDAYATDPTRDPWTESRSAPHLDEPAQDYSAEGYFWEDIRDPKVDVRPKADAPRELQTPPGSQYHQRWGDEEELGYEPEERPWGRQRLKGSPKEKKRVRKPTVYSPYPGMPGGYVPVYPGYSDTDEGHVAVPPAPGGWGQVGPPWVAGPPWYPY